MTDSKNEAEAESFYTKGMSYNWRQAESPAASTLARAAFRQAASMGHAAALRALADMNFDDEWGSRDRELALTMMWSAFRQCDHEALEALEDMLETYGETTEDKQRAKGAIAAAGHVKELKKQWENVNAFIKPYERSGSKIDREGDQAKVEG